MKNWIVLGLMNLGSLAQAFVCTARVGVGVSEVTLEFLHSGYCMVNITGLRPNYSALYHGQLQNGQQVLTKLQDLSSHHGDMPQNLTLSFIDSDMQSSYLLRGLPLCAGKVDFILSMQCE